MITAEDKWLYFIKQISQQNHIPEPLASAEFKEACETAERIKWSEAELNAYEDAFVRATDQQTSLELAEEKGIEKGIVKGQEEGRKEGELNKALSIAQEMLAEKLDIKTIAKFTKLSVEQIEELKKHQ